MLTDNVSNTGVGKDFVYKARSTLHESKSGINLFTSELRSSAN